MHRQSLIDYGKPLQATEAPTPAPIGQRGAAARLALRRVPLRPPPAGRLFRSRRRPEARRARQPAAAVHARATRSPASWRRRGPTRTGVTQGQALRRLSLDRLRQVRAVRARATSTCATRRACSASPSTAATPRTCWCRIRAICSTWRASRPEIAGALMCSGLTGYGAIKKAIPYLRVGPAADRRSRRRRHDGAAVRARPDGQADLRRRHRRRASARPP